MNTENIQAVSAALKQLYVGPVPGFPNAGFRIDNLHVTESENFEDESPDCKTAGCIMGWGVAILDDLPEEPELFAAMFGLSFEEMGRLTMPGNEEEVFYEGRYLHWQDDASMFTLDAAIATLDRLLETGEVDWVYGLENPYAPEPAARAA